MARAVTSSEGGMNAGPVQLPLNLRLPAHAKLETFVSGPNAGALQAVRNLAETAAERQIYLCGPAGVGKSHLLQALCRAQGERSWPSVYLPLRQMAPLGAHLLEGVEELSTVCVDDVDVVAGDAGWELALFGMINRCRDAECALVLTSRRAPAHLEIALPDLSSRLAWGPVFRLGPLDDEDKITALRTHASQRGLRISEEVGRYLVSRYSRELGALLGLLDTLDEVSLATQRRITIPLIRSVLAARDSNAPGQRVPPAS